jgi:Phosphoinositide phospholipase C, Ca2+-dependent
VAQPLGSLESGRPGTTVTTLSNRGLTHDQAFHNKLQVNSRSMKKLKAKARILFLLTLIQFCFAEPYPEKSAGQWTDNSTIRYKNGRWVDVNVPLNYQFQASVHNAYLKQHTLYEILRDYSTNIELDIFDVSTKKSPNAGTYLPGDWYVRHDSRDPNEDVNCIADGDQDRLSQCLAQIKRFHDDYPSHDLITIWLDKKQAWQGVSECDLKALERCRLSQNLDRLLSKVFGADALFTPLDFLAYQPSANTLRSAANNGWPAVSTLRGKIMVVITDARFEDNRNLNDYLNARGGQGLAFVAPKMKMGTVEKPVGLSGNEHSVVFYNLSGDRRELGPEIFAKNRISRTWGVDFTQSGGNVYRDLLIQNGAGDAYSSQYRYTGALISQ